MVTTVAAPQTAPPEGLTERRVLLWCLWCAPVFVVVFFGAILLSGFLPPPSETLGPEQVAALYAEHTDLRRLGFLLMFLAGGITAPFAVAIHHELRRIPGARPLALLQLIGGGLGVMAVSGPAIVFMVAAFRPERDPQVTQALHDLGMLPLIGNLVPFLIQAIPIGVAALMPESRLPRWLGFYTLWTSFLTLPGLLLIFFRDGAFALNGLLVFWVVATIFGAWFLVLFAVLRSRLLTGAA